MRIQLVTKETDDACEGALIVDGRFKKASIGSNTADLMDRVLAPMLSKLDEGTEVVIEVMVSTAAQIAAEEERVKVQGDARNAG